jgi:hypothetical protein
MTHTYHRHFTRVSLVCLLCSHVAGAVYVSEDGGRRTLVPGDGMDPAYLLRRVCQRCGGRLWAQDAAPALVLLPLPEEERPPRGRPPGPGKPTLGRTLPPCRSCGVRRASKVNGPRCKPCAADHADRHAWEQERLFERVVRALREGPLRSDQLGPRVGVSASRVRHLVRLLRNRGVPIVTEGWSFRLAEGVAS